MKMVMIVYNEALDNEVMEILEGLAVKGYTKITKVFGRGERSGTHLGTDIWPGLNNVLYVASEEASAKAILLKIKELRGVIGHEGAKAFIFAMEDST